MYKRVFQKKFPDSATATAHLDATGWGYKGRKGFLRKYHLYEGVIMKWDGEISEQCEARLYQDGYVEVFYEYNRHGTCYISDFPVGVWRSKEAFDAWDNRLNEFNYRLANELGHHFVMFNAGRDSIAVHRLEKSDPRSFGKSKVDPAVSHFTTGPEAFEWAAAESQKILAGH